VILVDLTRVRRLTQWLSGMFFQGMFGRIGVYAAKR